MEKQKVRYFKTAFKVQALFASCCLLQVIGAQAQEIANAPTIADEANFSLGLSAIESAESQAASLPAALQCGEVLIYDNNSRYQSAQQAAANLGVTYTLANSSNFNSLITSQTWDLVLMDLPSNEPAAGWQTNLVNHIVGGGKAIHSHWNPGTLTAPLQAAFEVSNQGLHDTIDFYSWDSHALFSSPNSVPAVFDVWADVWGINGFYLEPTGSAESAAGFTPAPAANNAAIVIGNAGDTIFNGFLFDDYYPADKDGDGVRDIVELLENEMVAVCTVRVAIDIKFCSDPNAFNCGKNGVLPVTIFGTDTFNVADIDVSTLQLCTEDGDCTGAPRDYSIADRGDPDSDLGAAMCAINPETGEEEDFLNPDGFNDMDAAFEASEVQAILGDFCAADKGAVSGSLVLTGATLDGTQVISIPVGNLGIDQLLKQNK